MKSFLPVVFLFMLIEVSAQTISKFLDVRDSTWYSTVEIGGEIWFQENLRYETKGCFCKGRKKKKELCKITNYYPYKELKDVCPADWHVATLSEWEKVIEVVKLEHEMDLSLIKYDTIENGSVVINSDEFQLMENQTDLKFQKIGWVQGRWIQQKQNTTMWINNEAIEDDRYHIHFGNSGYVKHTHSHNVDDKKRRVRRFAVRCVKD